MLRALRGNAYQRGGSRPRCRVRRRVRLGPPRGWAASWPRSQIARIAVAVRDMTASVEWYHRALGLDPGWGVRAGRGRSGRTGGTGRAGRGRAPASADGASRQLPQPRGA
ncbi:VOC family protein [Streptomyces sp. NPDC088400]|uniref:VOC family protein n=1 Tax=Streptomyces sp. NPDC088400 TaxID=3365861 RepID=UPI00382F4FB2